jgi:repressor of nif and glnA expression
MYTISFGDPMNDLLRLGGQAFLTLLREGAGHLFAAIRSLNVHGYDKFYMLQTTKKIR